MSDEKANPDPTGAPRAVAVGVDAYEAACREREALRQRAESAEARAKRYEEALRGLVAMVEDEDACSGDGDRALSVARTALYAPAPSTADVSAGCGAPAHDAWLAALTLQCTQPDACDSACKCCSRRWHRANWKPQATAPSGGQPTTAAPSAECPNCCGRGVVGDLDGEFGQCRNCDGAGRLSSTLPIAAAPPAVAQEAKPAPLLYTQDDWEEGFKRAAMHCTHATFPQRLCVGCAAKRVLRALADPTGPYVALLTPASTAERVPERDEPSIKTIREAFLRIHDVAMGREARAYMSIPADPRRDADLIVSAAIEELERLRAERDRAVAEAVAAERARLLDLAMDAWGVIANAGGGDWDRETPGWRDAAERWRDRFHVEIGARARSTPGGET